MDFFDIFIFNNVKSRLKIILCQPNKVVFKVKVLHLQRLYTYRKPQWAEVGQTYIRYKAFLYALVLTIDELRKFNCKSKTKQCRTPHEVYYIQPSLASDNSICLLSRVLSIYLHWRGAFGVVSALYIARRYFLFVTYLIISRYTKTQT